MNTRKYYEGEEGIYRGMLKLVYWQVEGLFAGYSMFGKQLKIEDIYFLNADG